MVKEFKFFQKQAERAERMARAASDAEISQSFLGMAEARQANLLKAMERAKTKKKVER
jgi:hypothetical protein